MDQHLQLQDPPKFTQIGIFGLKKMPSGNPETWGRCYDHNFLRFLAIFGEKNGVFLKNQCNY
jgi:hypothetical protein